MPPAASESLPIHRTITVEEDHFPGTGSAMAGAGELIGGSGGPLPVPSRPQLTLEFQRVSWPVPTIPRNEPAAGSTSGGSELGGGSAAMTTREESPSSSPPQRSRPPPPPPPQRRRHPPADVRETEGWLTLDLALFTYSTGVMICTVAEIKDDVHSWGTAAKVVFGVMTFGAVGSLGTGLMTAGYRRLSGMNRHQTGGLSGFYARFSTILSTALFIIVISCKFGRVGRVAGFFSAALIASIMTVFWIREGGRTAASVWPSGSDEAPEETSPEESEHRASIPEYRAFFPEYRASFPIPRYYRSSSPYKAIRHRTRY